MKLTLLASTLLVAGMLTAPSFSAADETITTTKTTTYNGIVSEIDPSSSTIILKSEASPSPVTYSYTKETSFVDASGNVVSYETIRNSPVRVEYMDDGGRRIVRRVVQTGPAVIVPSAPAVVVPGVPTMQKRTHTETHSETID